jgi:hypothetical protein
MDIYFTQVTNDWVVNPGKNTPTKNRYEARKCTIDDFRFDVNVQTPLDNWNGFDLICPDIGDDEEALFLKGE